MTNLSFDSLPEKTSEILSKLEAIHNLLENQIQRPIEQQKEELLTIPQCAKFLSLATPTIYSMVSSNRIPFMKKDKRVYFSKQDLITWLQESRRLTQDQIKAQAERYVKGGAK